MNYVKGLMASSSKKSNSSATGSNSSKRHDDNDEVATLAIENSSDDEIDISQLPVFFADSQQASEIYWPNYEDDSGDAYSGTMNTSKERHGVGMLSKSKSTMIGQWFKNELNGLATLSKQSETESNNMSTGVWENGQLVDGFVRMSLPQDDYRLLKNITKDFNITYIGEFKDGCYANLGRLTGYIRDHRLGIDHTLQVAAYWVNGKIAVELDNSLRESVKRLCQDLNNLFSDKQKKPLLMKDRYYLQKAIEEFHHSDNLHSKVNNLDLKRFINTLRKDIDKRIPTKFEYIVRLSTMLNGLEHHYETFEPLDNHSELLSQLMQNLSSKNDQHRHRCLRPLFALDKTTFKPHQEVKARYDDVVRFLREDNSISLYRISDAGTRMYAEWLRLIIEYSLKVESDVRNEFQQKHCKYFQENWNTYLSTENIEVDDNKIPYDKFSQCYLVLIEQLLNFSVRMWSRNKAYIKYDNHNHQALSLARDEEIIVDDDGEEISRKTVGDDVCEAHLQEYKRILQTCSSFSFDCQYAVPPYDEARNLIARITGKFKKDVEFSHANWNVLKRATIDMLIWHQLPLRKSPTHTPKQA